MNAPSTPRAHPNGGLALCMLVGAVALVGVLASGRASLAAAHPLPARISRFMAVTDTAESQLTVTKDTPDEYRASGTWAFVDRDDPPDGFFIDNGAADIDITGTNWEFGILAFVGDWCIGSCGGKLNGADDIDIAIDGTHKVGPHPEDSAFNYLPLISQKYSDIDWSDEPAKITTQKRQDHQAGDKIHHDLYGFEFYASALEGPPNQLAGDVEVAAKHTTSTDQREKLTFGGATVSSSAAGSRATFDPGTGKLTLHFGTIDGLNDTGLMLAGIDPAFAADPILNGTIGDVVMTYLGPTGDGGFRFGGAHVQLVDPEGAVSIEGGFSEYDIYDTSRNGMIDSYALMDSVRTSDGGTCQSGFLNEFDDLDIMGHSLSSSDWLDVQGVGLCFSTPTNLVLLTGGFTLPVDVAATVGVCALKRIPGTQTPGSPR